MSTSPDAKSPTAATQKPGTKAAAKPTVKAAAQPATKAGTKAASTKGPVTKTPLKPSVTQKTKTPVAAKPAPKTLAKPASPVVTKPSAAASGAKPKKAKLVRDSFTIPKAEYTVLEGLKMRSVKLGKPAKKSEILRAGIKALSAMSDSALATALAAVPTIKTGRPKLS